MPLYAPLGAVCAAALLLACSDKPNANTPAAPAAPPAPAAAAPAPSAAPASAARQVLDSLLSHEGLGMNLAYIEKQAGPAIRSQGHTHSFEIEQCQLELTTDEHNRSVQHIRLALTPQCTVTSQGLMQTQPPVPLNTLTFQDLETHFSPGQFTADCLRSCGNAAPSWVYFAAEGSRADQFLTLVLEASLDQDDVWDKTQPWLDAMEKGEGEDWILETRFNCEPQKYKDAALQALGPVRASHLSFGQSPLYPQCDATDTASSAAPSATLVTVPAPRGDCDMQYDQHLQAAGLQVKEVAVHGPDEPDFGGWGCPYRITPQPGTPVPAGSTVTYRFGWEAG